MSVLEKNDREEFASELTRIFSQNLREVMLSSGVNTRELASRIGMDESDVSKIVRGLRRVWLETAVKISIALDVNIGALTGNVSENMEA